MSIPPITPRTSLIHTGQDRRQVGAEISALETHMLEHPMTDSLSLQIQGWLHRFRQQWRASADATQVFKEAREELERFLRDPLRQEPLDDQALLGNDGLTYGLQVLSVHLSQTPEEEHQRSPIHREREVRFSTEPHPLARAVVKWVMRHNPQFLPSEEIRGRFGELKRTNTLPLIPSPTSDRIRALQRILQERGRSGPASAAAASRPAPSLADRVGEFSRQAARISAAASQVFNRADEIRRTADAILGRMRQLETDQEARRQAADVLLQFEGGDARRILQRVEAFARRIDELNSEDAERMGEFERQEGELRQDLGEAQRANAQFKREMRELRARIANVEQSNISLAQEIEKTRQAIEEKKSSGGGIFETLGMIGLCVVISLALPELMALPQGSTAVLRPFAGGKGAAFIWSAFI